MFLRGVERKYPFSQDQVGRGEPFLGKEEFRNQRSCLHPAGGMFAALGKQGGNRFACTEANLQIVPRMGTVKGK